jgi:ABC-2 type transport system ATP-binding protein
MSAVNMSSTSTIEVERVTKRYGDVVAVSDVSFAIGPGVTGLLGPNGAGKTTLLKMMTGLLVPTSGQVRVLGEPVRASLKLYGRLGYCPESDRLYDFMTGREFLELMARLQGLRNPREAARRALEQVDLLPQSEKKIGAYSRGMRQRLKVAQALLHDPDVLLLDEPLKGADPTQRAALIELICELGVQGKTVIVSSHILHEVERMASQIVLIHRGRLLALGDFHAIREQMDDRPHKVLVRTRDPKKLAAALTAQGLIAGVDLRDGELIAEVNDPEAFYSRLPKLAVEADVRITHISGVDEDLESVFRYLVA